MKKEQQTEFEKKVLEQFMSGENLFGKGGAFAPMLKNVIERALEAEMDGHLNEVQRIKGKTNATARARRRSRVAMAPSTSIRPRTGRAALNRNL